MTRNKKPEADLRLMYRKALELGFIASLFLMLVLFHGLPAIDMTPKDVKAKDIEIKVEDIPQTEQIKKAPPPPRPTIPIPTESEDVPEDLTIESTELDLSEIPPPPGPPMEDSYETYQFIPYDEAPVPIGGYAVIQRNLKYPEIARKAGIEAYVVVGVLIDEHGKCVKTQILKSSGQKLGFEEAARQAVMTVRWKPAKQRDRAVKVWVSIPIRFSLRGGNRST
ncbi:MAG: energy transducer TonB [Calditrichaeota bacterium]|nr:MAG: energy transducer TonB [Calditrichota bacterium]